MKPLALAVRRYRSNLNYQWKAAGTVLDWTVMLYFIIPGLLLFGKFYMDWWLNPLDVPELLKNIQLWSYLFMFPLFWTGLRTWQEAADILFLRQLPDWWQTFIRFGLVLLFMRQALVIVIWVLAALPWIIKGFGIPYDIVMRISWLAWLLSCLSALLLNHIHVRLQGWWMKTVSFFITAGMLLSVRIVLLPISSHLLGTIVLSLVLTGIFVPFIRWRIHANYTFERDIDLESEAKLKLTNMLLAQVVEKPPRRRQGKRTMLFSRSGYFIHRRTSGIQIGAIAVKTLWRSSSHLRFYMQLIGIGTGAAVISTLNEPVLFFIIAPILAAMTGYWLNSYWRELLTSDLWSLYIYSPSDLRKAASHYVVVNSIIPAFLWSGLSALMMPSLQSGLIAFVAGIVMVIYVSLIVMISRGWKVRESPELGE